MSSRINASGTRQIFRLFESGTVAGLSESELIDRFVIRRDELAFEALVVRHGPMVLGVCRRFLYDQNDIEDAFQATFLVLVQKAARLREREKLAPWLHGVARQVSRRARAQRAKRGVRFGQIDLNIQAPMLCEHPFSSYLDDELARLSEGDRLVIALCDLNGLSSDEAAQSLGIKAVTFRSRLHRARMRLKARLERRGIAQGAGLTTIGLSVAVSEALAAATLKSAISYSAGAGVGSVITVAVATLTQGAIRSMFFTKLKVASVALAAAAGLAGSTAFVFAQAPDGKDFQTTPSTAGPSLNEAPFVLAASSRSNSAPRAEPSDSDRLREVEAKLDRILTALNRNASAAPSVPPSVPPRAAPTLSNEAIEPKEALGRFAQVQDALLARPRALTPTLPTPLREPTRPGAAPPTQTVTSVEQVRSTDPSSPASLAVDPTSVATFTPQSANALSGVDIAALLKRVAELEKKVQNLESRLHSTPDPFENKPESNSARAPR